MTPERLREMRPDVYTVFADFHELAEVAAEMAEALERVSVRDDYCVACDCHPSHGHRDDCALARFAQLGEK